jgi:hypothetical protein
MQKTPPLGRSVSRDVLDWDHVEPRRANIGKDGLGLSPEDRSALGMSAPRAADLEHPHLGGAETALADVLARGGAIRPDFRRKR